MDEPQCCRAHWGGVPQRATSDARGWDEINVLLLGLYTDHWRSYNVLILVHLVDW